MMMCFRRAPPNTHGGTQTRLLPALKLIALTRMRLQEAMGLRLEAFYPPLEDAEGDSLAAGGCVTIE